MKIMTPAAAARHFVHLMGGDVELAQEALDDWTEGGFRNSDYPAPATAWLYKNIKNSRDSEVLAAHLDML